MIKGTIFDMDGTIVDSMQMWHNAGVEYLKTLDIEGDDELGDRMFTMTIPIAADYLLQEYGLAERGISKDQIIDGINDHAANFYKSKVEAKEGAISLIRRLHDSGIPVTIASSSERHLVEIAMQRIGVLDYIDEIFSCVDYKTTKAKPDIFHEAARMMGTNPEDTWVFEDGLYAIKTANEHGYKTVGLYDLASHRDWEDIQKSSTVSAIDCAHVDIDAMMAMK